MRLVFRGHNGRPRVQRVSLQRLQQVSGNRRQDRGYFHHHGSYQVRGERLQITFRPTIYLNQALSGDERAEVLRHEQEHFADFQDFARNFKGSLEDAVAGGSLNNDEVDRRWAWFLYDVCSASAALHRREGGLVEHCFRPSGSRPR